MVNGPSPGPAPAAQARDSSSRLTRSNWRTWPHRKLRRKSSQGGWRLDYAADGASCPAPTQHVGVVNEVAPSQRRGHQGQQLVSRVRPPRRVSQVDVAIDDFTQAQVLGEGHREEQPSIGHQAVVVKRDLDAIGMVCVVASIGCSLFWGRLCCFKTIIPDSQEHPLAASGHCPDALLRWIRG